VRLCRPPALRGARSTFLAYRRALDAVDQLTDPRGWDANDAVERLTVARAQFELANATHRTQARAPIEDRRDFADRVRGFFRPRTVAGIVYEGINAAHEPDVAVTDVVLGTDDHRYRLYLQQSVRGTCWPSTGPGSTGGSRPGRCAGR
jgi:hypothetical protein